MQSQSTLKDQGNYGDDNKTGMYTFLCKNHLQF